MHFKIEEWSFQSNLGNHDKIRLVAKETVQHEISVDYVQYVQPCVNVHIGILYFLNDERIS